MKKLALSTVLAAALLVLGATGTASAQETVPQFEFSFTTTPANPLAGEGRYAPLNVVAAWVTDDQGNFVKTVYETTSIRTNNLTAWTAIAPAVEVDVTSSATRASYDTPVVGQWDLNDALGTPVLDGIYHLYMELADAEQAECLDCIVNLESYAFEIDRLERTQSLLTCLEAPCIGFENVTASYALVPVEEEDDGGGDGGGDGTGGGDGSGGGDGVGSGDRDITVVGGCSTSGGSAPAAPLALAFLGLVWGLRRRRS
jgi:MYXO-CTERM domain-containing protein